MQPADDIGRLGQLAITHELRIAVVESLTSGGLAHAIGAGEEASRWFAGGIVAYMTDVKQHLLKLTAGVDPCSVECAEQLAVGGLELFAADVCISTTGVGGPDPEDGHPPGTVYLGWATHDQQGHEHLQLDGGPDAVLAATVDAALHLLRARAEQLAHHADAVGVWSHHPM
ncbi:CinA family protein [Microbacterium murale]|uniref:Competence protein n=1 Tax=Microbacterium murale TaxID=1081040 RepID=A0ABQ1S0L6_9MICO|nr:nicotinamide-nucleotide amidohydrolase family protein [Microbacterium murale]GGD88586.1 competence protein [Microbacterium murale]